LSVGDEQGKPFNQRRGSDDAVREIIGIAANRASTSDRKVSS